MLRSFIILILFSGFIINSTSNSDISDVNYKKKYGLLKKDIRGNINKIKNKDSIKWEYLKKKHKLDERENEFKKKELTNLELKLKNEALDQEMLLRWVYIGSMCIVLLILVLLIYLIVRQNQIKYKANRMLENKTNFIEKQKSELMSNIAYAKKIQELYIPGNDNAYNDDECFIINKPKDIVSGDFYWFLKLDDGNRVFIVADCTGHGVPGGFLSVISYTILKDIIESGNYNNPATMLNKLHSDFIKRLSVHEDADKISDGLDIIIGIHNSNNSTIQFSSAKMPPVFVSDNILTEKKPDILSIGFSSLSRKVYKKIEMRLHEHSYKTGDMLYLFTDGFADQFNHENKKQIHINKFYALLKEVSALNIIDQKEKISDYFETWKGDNKQTDDVLVVGIRL